MAFDLDGARKAGYSDAEIVDHLAKERGFDAGGARRGGYSDAELLSHLRPSIEEAGTRSVADRATRGLGLGVRDVVEGAAAIPGMVADAVGYPVRLAGRAMGYEMERPTEALSGALTAAGLPVAETPMEQGLSAGIRGAASALPTMGAGLALQAAGRAPAAVNALLGAPISQMVGGFTGGAAGEEARQGGFGPAVQTGASLLGGLGGAGAVTAGAGAARGTGAAFMPFAQSGREAMARDVLLRSSSAPETLVNRLMQGADAERLPGAPVTTAQQARDPGLMVMEQGLRSQVQGTGTAAGASPAARFRDVEAQRNALRADAINVLSDGSTPEVRGNTVRQALQGAEGAMGERVGMLYQQVDPQGTGRFVTAPIVDRAQSATRMFEDLGGGMPAELQGVIDDVARAGDQISFPQLQNLRSRLGEIAGKASSTGDNRLASSASQIMAAVEEVGSSPRWQAATAGRREMGEALGRDATGTNATGQILRTDRFGAPMLADKDVANRALSSPGSLRQTMEAGYKALEDARNARLPPEQIADLADQVRDMRRALRGQFIENMMGATRTTGVVADAGGNTSQVLSPAGFHLFFEKNSAVANDLFEPGQTAQLHRLASDFAETSMARTVGKASGSDTAQNLSVANVIGRATNGLIDPGNPLMQTIAGIGPVMKLIYAAPEAAVREMLTEAMVNPAFARDLLSRASPESMRRALGYVEQTMGERLRVAAGEATARQGVRSTGEVNRPQSPARTNRLMGPGGAPAARNSLLAP